MRLDAPGGWPGLAPVEQAPFDAAPRPDASTTEAGSALDHWAAAARRELDAMPTPGAGVNQFRMTELVDAGESFLCDAGSAASSSARETLARLQALRDGQCDEAELKALEVSLGLAPPKTVQRQHQHVRLRRILLRVGADNDSVTDAASAGLRKLPDVAVSETVNQFLERVDDKLRRFGPVGWLMDEFIDQTRHLALGLDAWAAGPEHPLHAAVQQTLARLEQMAPYALVADEEEEELSLLQFR